MPFHHKVNEGLVKCTDCHDPHGTFGNSALRSTADANMICTKCHTEVRGPFVFEHAPVKAGLAWVATPARIAERRLLKCRTLTCSANSATARSPRIRCTASVRIERPHSLHGLPHLHSWLNLNGHFSVMKFGCASNGRRSLLQAPGL